MASYGQGLLSKEIQDDTLLPNAYKYFTLPTELDGTYERRPPLILLIAGLGVRNDLYLIDWHVHVILTNNTTSRPAEPKLTVIKARKKLRTINAGGRICVCFH